MTTTQWHNPNGYDVDEYGTIESPGKFESEPIYAPYFWDEDSTDTVYVDDHAIEFYIVDDDDRAKFPGLLDDVYGIALSESDQGFVNVEEFSSEAAYKTRVRELEALPPSEPGDDDITTTDHETFYQNGKQVLWPVTKISLPGRHWRYRDARGHGQELGAYVDGITALRAYMERVQFWPNAWFISDHGNAHLINLSEGK
jgi:hypothetical protein